jgi:hypothetical protein
LPEAQPMADVAAGDGGQAETDKVKKKIKKYPAYSFCQTVAKTKRLIHCPPIFSSKRKNYSPLPSDIL